MGGNGNTNVDATLEILVVDDDDVDRMAVGRALKASGLPARIHEEGDCAGALSALVKRPFDCAFLDFALPDGDGMELLRQAKARRVPTPLVVLTGSGSEGLAVEMLRAGATDYMTKSQLSPDGLAHAVRRAVRLRQAEESAQQAQQALQDSEDRFRLLLADVQDYAIFMLDNEGCVVSWNTGAQRILGYETDEVLGRPFALFFTPEDRRKSLPAQELTTARRTGRADDERWHLRRDGSLFWASGVTTALRDRDGSVCGFATILRDLTERKRWEQSLLANQQRISALNTHLRIAMQETHHRVKNSLQVISSLVEMRVTEGPAQIPVNEVKALGLHIRMLAAVHELLTRKAQEDGAAQTLCAAAVLEQLLPMIHKVAGGKELSANFEPAQITAQQALSLSLIAHELVANAARFAAREIALTLIASADTAVFTVADDGPGFSPGFDPDRDQRTGLELVRMLGKWDMGGSIAFTNRPEGGAQVLLMMTANRE